MGRLVRPDADVVGFLLLLDPVSHAEAPTGPGKRVPLAWPGTMAGR